MPTVPSSTQSTPPMSPTTSSLSGCTAGPSRAFSTIARDSPGGSGNFSSMSGSTRATSALAWASVTPGFSRASPW